MSKEKETEAQYQARKNEELRNDPKAWAELHSQPEDEKFPSLKGKWNEFHEADPPNPPRMEQNLEEGSYIHLDEVYEFTIDREKFKKSIEKLSESYFDEGCSCDEDGPCGFHQAINAVILELGM